MGTIGVMAEIPVSFGEWVQDRRKDLDLTRNELALKVGCSPVTIKKIERDERKPSRQIAELLAIHLQLGPDLYDLFVKRARGQFVETSSAPTDPAPAPTNQQHTTTHLPELLGPLIGRKEELPHLRDILQEPAKQLVTLVGTGGIGKSRLALQVAHDLAGDMLDGVYWIDFTSHSKQEFIVPAIAKALDLTINKEARLPEKQLLDWLRPKQALLIFDNFDNLIDEAQFLADLLDQSAALKILVTSRERLNLQQERVFPLEGLAFPRSAEEFRDGSYPAVEFYVQSARKISPTFALTAENIDGVIQICRLVSGMPLSLELAAAWVDMLSAAEIAEEIQNSLDFLETNLRNVPERHKSIRAIFDASWEKLNDREKKIFARLTIFHGGFSRRAARSVAGASLPVLARLVDRSLIRYDATRESYRLNGLLRQYGSDKLEKQESADALTDLHERHSVYYLEALSERSENIKGDGQQTAIAQISRDLNNVRQAWRWAVDHQKSDLIQIGMEPFANFLDFKGRYIEGETIFLNLLKPLNELPNQNVAQPLFLNAITWLSVFEFALNKVDRGERSLNEANRIVEEMLAQEKKIDRQRAFVLVQMGNLEMTRDPAKARPLYLQALELHERLKMGWEQAATMMALGSADRMLGDFEQASQRFSQSLEIRQQIGDQIGAAGTMAIMSELRRNRGQFYEAILQAQNGVDLARQIKNDNVLAMALSELAMAFYYDGQFPKQHQALVESLMLNERLNHGHKLAQTYFRLTMANCALGQFEDAQSNSQKGLNLARQLGNQSQIALLFFAQAIISMSVGSFDSGKQLLQNGLAAFPPATQPTDKNATEILIALAESRIGNPTPAKRCLAQTLQRAFDHKDSLSLLLNFGVAALVLAEQQQIERAIILWEMVQRMSPGLQQAVWLRRLYGDRLKEVSASLSADQRENIEAYLQSHSLWDEADTLLKFMIKEKWDRPRQA